jgi:hypothetical protein
MTTILQSIRPDSCRPTAPHEKLSDMTKRYDGQLFQNVRDEASTFEDLEFTNCDFDAIGLSVGVSPDRFTTLRNCTFTNSRVSSAVFVGNTCFEDVTIDGLSARTDLQVAGAQLRHVVLRGAIDEVRFNISSGFGDEATQLRRAAINAANQAWYKEVDWALDIREARFTTWVEIVNVPGHLVLHDPERAAVITAERARAVDYKSVDWGDAPIIPAITRMLSRGHESRIVVVPSKGQLKRPMLAALDTLRSLGLAEPAADQIEPLPTGRMETH